MTFCRLLPVLLGAGGLLLIPGGVRAHGIESSLERLGSLSAGLESRFSSGLPASDAAVRLVPAGGGTPIELGHTDAQGRLSFILPARASADWEILVDAGAGHRDYLELREAEPAAPQRRSRPRLEAAAELHQGLTERHPWGQLGLVGLGGGLLARQRRR